MNETQQLIFNELNVRIGDFKTSLTGIYEIDKITMAKIYELEKIRAFVVGLVDRC